jgi:hypothetical protein
MVWRIVIMQSIGVYGDVELITKWWPPLEAAGYTVTVRPPLSEKGIPERDGRIYRGGTVATHGCSVGIITSYAIAPFSKTHPLSGEPALFVCYGGFFKKTRARRAALAEEIVNVYLEKGMQRVADARK